MQEHCKNNKLVNVRGYPRAFPGDKKRGYICDKCRQCDLYRQYTLYLPPVD